MKILSVIFPDAVYKTQASKRLNIIAILVTAIILFFNSNIASAQCSVVGNPSSGQRGSDFCSPVVKQVWYRFDFATKPPAASYRVLYQWGDGSVNNNYWPEVKYESLFPGDTTWYVLTEPIKTYIDNDGVCDYVTTIVLVDGGYQCGDSRQTQEIASWHTDDTAPAQGIIDVTADIIEVCEGDSLIDSTFRDASSFACNVNITDIRKPNNQPRYVQFVYNTSPTSGQGIPYVSIDVHGTKVYLTDEDGDPVDNKWTVNPMDGTTIGEYSTNSGFFEGPVISTGFNPVGGSQITFPISFPGTTTVAGDYMQVTVRNWNFCNPWNSSQTNPNAGDAKLDSARIVIIDSPNPPTVPDETICEGEDRTLTATSAPVGEIRWYSDSIKTTLLTTGSTYIPPDDLPGIYSFWVSDAAIAGNGCESQLTKVTLTIREPLPQPGDITGPTDICVNATGLEFYVDDAPATMPFGGATEYVWSVPGGWSITDETSTKITVTAGGATGAQQVSVVRAYTTVPNCPGDAQTHTVTVYAQPVAQTIIKNPDATEVCTNGNASATFSGGSGGVSSTDIYQSSTDGGVTWSAYTPGNNISSAVIGADRLQIRTRRESAGAGCNNSDWNTATWDVVAPPVAQTIIKSPDVADVCTNGSVSATFTGGSGGVDPVDVYQSSVNGGSTWSTYTPGSNISSSTTGTNRIQIRTRRTSSGSGCTDSDWNTVTWNVVAQPVAQNITKDPNVSSVCTGGEVSATFTGGSGGVDPVDVYQSSIDGGVTYQTYTPGTKISSAITGTNRIRIRTRRTSTGTGCNTSAWRYAYWTVVAQPVAQTITKNPDVAEVCTGGTVSATFSGGSGGVSPVDVYERSIDGGVTWSAYTSGTGISSATPGINRIQIRTRRESTGTGCVNSDYNIVTWTVVAQPVAQTITKNPDVTEVCTSGSVSATFAGGSGGVSPVDVYESSIDAGVTWSAYSPGTGISSAVPGTDRIQIRTRRESTGTGCVHSGYNTVTWTVVAQPVAQTITKNPDISDVCTGGTVSATFSGGSGGISSVDVYQSSTDGGSTWSAYIPGNTISSASAGADRIQIRTRRESAGTGCSNSDWNTAIWTVVAQPVGPTLNTKTPNQAEICEGENVSATFNAGSGGVGCLDAFQYRFDGAGGWTMYTPGDNLITSEHTQVEIQGQRAGCDANTGCTGTAWVTLAEWTVNPLPDPAISGNNNVCENAVGLTYSTPPDALSTFLWEISGGTITGGQGTASITVDWGLAGSGWVKVTQTITATTCDFMTPNYAIVINPGSPSDIPSINGPDEACISIGSITLSSSEVGYAAQYEWDTPSGSIITGGQNINYSINGLVEGSYNFRVRGKNGCGDGPWSDYHVLSIVPQPVAQTITKNPDVTEICTGGTVSATFSGGSGGVSPVDVYQSSTDGGTTWAAYTPGNPLSSATTGTDRIQIRTRRESLGAGCVHSGYNTVTWTVVAQPVAQTITKNPDVAEVCTGGSVSATFSGGSGGVSPVDIYESSTDGGSTWSAYTPGNPLSSAITGTDRIQVRTRRESAGTGCNNSDYNTVTWTVVAQPVAQTITKNPDVAEVCTGGSVSATFSGGSGGVSPVDVYESSINGGSSWSAYTPGNPLSSAIPGIDRIQVRTRRESSGTGCVNSGYNTVTWTVIAQPVAQTITKNPNVAEVCTGGSVSATFSGGSGGISPVDVYESSINGGSSWSAYTPGNPLSSATPGTDRIQVRTRREVTGTGCSNSDYNTVTWTVVAQPVAQTITKNPNVAEVCTGGSVSATFSGGSGGVSPVDVYESSTDEGATWSAYTPGNPLSSAITGTDRIQVRTRRESAGTGCTNSGYNTVTWTVVAQPVAQTITKNPDVTEVCTGGSVSATFSGGSGGVSPVDVYESSTDGGATWAAYTPGNPISSATPGTDRIQIRTRRESSGTGCVNSGYNTVTWTVIAQPVAQTITKNPDVAEVCTGGTVSATFSGGSGGILPVDVYESSIDGGSTWSAYTPGNPISSATPGTDRIQVRTRRESAGPGCTNSGYNTVTWTVVAQPVAQTITKNPDVAEVCTGGSVSATFSGGSGGVSPVDVYESSTDGGATWAAYTPGNPLSSAITGTDRIRIRTRRESAGTGCTNSGYNTVTWTVVAQPVAQTITKNPDVTEVCTGGSVSATFSGGSGGVSPVDVYESSTDGGATWAAYTPGNLISSATPGTDRIRIRTRRESSGTGCTNSGYNTVTWTVVAQPVAQTITKNPDVAEVCTGGTVSATFSGGSGGILPVDVYESSIDGGSTWSAYTPGNPLSSATPGTDRIRIRTRRESAGPGCTNSGYNTVTWTVVAQPVAQTITKNPDVAEVCTGGSVSATFSGGSGGVSPVDVYESSTNGGSTWSAYTPGNPLSSAITGTDRIQVRTRRESAGTGCTNSGYNTVTWTVVAQPVAQTITKNPDVTEVCTGGSVSATFSGGSGGVSPVDVYESSINGGSSWSAYTPGNPLSSATPGIDRIQVRTRRESSGTGCSNSDYNTVTWTVIAQPVAQTITKNPNVTEICVDGSVSATFSGGSGGVSPVDVYESSTDGGSSWSAYTPGNPLSSATPGTDRIQVRTRREVTGTGCSNSDYNTVTWTVVAQPVAQTIIKNPDAESVCVNSTASATFSGGSGGVSPVDVYQSSVNSGSTWLSYTSGSNLSSAIDGTDRIQVRTMRQSTGYGCVNSGWNTETWDVIPDPTSYAGPNGVICANETHTLSGALATNYSSLEWSTSGDGTFSDNNVLNPIYTPGATDKVNKSATLTIKAFGTGPCLSREAITTMTLTVNPLPVTSAISGKSIICETAKSEVYQVKNTSGSTYAWTLPASLTSSSPPGLYFIIVDAVPGAALPGDKITVTETFTSTTGCVGNPVDFPITVTPVSLGVDISGPSDVCVGDTGVIFSVPENAGSVYSWTVPPGASITSNPTKHSVKVTFSMALLNQNVSVTETTDGVCTTIHNSLSIDIHALPTLYNLAAPSYYCFGTSGVTVTLSSSQLNVEYQLLKNGIPEGPVQAGTGSALTWNNMTAGTYTASATSVNSPFCSVMMMGNPFVEENPAMFITDVAVTEPKCFGVSNGSIVITAAGGYPPLSSLSYSINGGTTYQSSATFTGIGAGTYNIIVKDTRNCTVSQPPVTVNQPTELIINSLTITDSVSCYGFSDGSAQVVASGGTPIAGSYAYQWYYDSGLTNPIPGQTSDEATGLGAGSYWIKVSDLNGCYKSGSITIPQPSLLTLSTSGNISLLCHGDSTASGSFTASGGTSPYTFTEISNSSGATINPPGAATIDFTGGGAGTIVIKVTDAHLCEAQATITITEPPALNMIATLSSSIEGSHNINCNGANTGGISLNVSGGVPPYTYTWSTLDGSGLIPGVANQTALTAGTYDVEVRDANNCTVNGSYTLTQPDILVATASTDDDLIGTCLASVANLGVAVSGGVQIAGNYNYSWSPASGLSATNIATPVAKPASTTTYTVIVTDANGCSKSSNVIIYVAPVLTASASTSDNQIGTCPASKALLNVTATGGEELAGGGYTYSWLPVDGLDDPSSKTPEAKPAVTTTYTVTVTDRNNCQTTANVTVNVAAPLAAVATASDPLIGTCPASTTLLDVSVSGGETLYTYLWDNAGTLQDPATKRNPVAKPGVLTTYTVTVTDGNGCTTTAQIPVDVAPELTATAIADDQIISTCPASVANLDVNVAGGEAGYTYKWSPVTGLDDPNIKTPVAKPSVTRLYTLTVTDANGCTAVSSVNITVQPVLSVSVASDDYILSTCPASVGNLSSVVAGGEPVYTYSWAPSAGLSADDIPNPVAKPDVTTTYTLTITDVNGCTASADLTITVRPALAATATATDYTIGTCPTSTSTLNVNVTGGESAYTYSWLPVDGLSATDISNPVAKPDVTTTYTVTVTDVNGCSTTADVTITVAPDLAATATADDQLIGTCPTSVANLDVTVAGGEAGYTYSWLPVTGLSNPTLKTPVAKPAVTTTYTVTVTDANGCTATSDILITVAPVLTATASTDDDKIGTCPTSVANLNVAVAGGEAAYTYSWSPVAGLTDPLIANPQAKPAATTTYTVTVTDANGCIASSNITVTVQPALTAVITASDYFIGTCLTSVSNLDVNVTGGEAAYSYSWLPVDGLSDPNIKNPVAKPLATTTYTVTVTDANNCTTTAQVTINVRDPLSATASADDYIIGTCPASRSNLNVTVTGGETAYTYSWLPVTGLNDPNVKNPVAKPAATTTYTVTVTDNNGCTTTADVTVTVQDPLAVTATTDDNILSSCPASVANLNATVTGGEAAYSYSWSPVSGLDDPSSPTPEAKPATTTTYTVIVTDANGCTATSSVVINVRPELAVTASASDYTIGTCLTSQSTLNVNVTGGEAGYLYSWTPVDGLSDAGVSNPVAKPLVTTTYTVTVTDANNCQTSANVTIIVAPELTVTTSVNDDLIGTCPDSKAQLIATPAGGEGPYTYSWDNATFLDNATKVNPLAKPDVSTVFTVTVTDANGCTATAQATVNVAPELTATAIADDQIISTCPASVANLDVNVAGGEAGYTYKWSPVTGLDDPNIKTPVAKPSVTRLYTVTVTDANGCTAVSSVNITVQPVLSVSVASDDYILSTCPASVGNLSSVVAGGEPVYTYSWAPSAGLSADDIPNPVAKPDVTTTYTLTITDVNGCTASADLTITVRPALAATATATDYTIGTCPTSTSTLNVNVTGGESAYTYSWLPVDGLSATDISNPVAKPDVTTTYTVTVTDVNGCSTTADVTITVAPDLAATATADDQLIGTCPTSVANLDVTVAGGEAGYTYSWLPVTGLSNPTLKTPVAKPAVTTTYTVTVTDANGCTATSDILITVAPVLTATASTDDDKIGTCPTSVANLNVAVAGGEAAYTYSWSPVAGLTDPLIANPQAKPAATTTYTVTVTDANGCIASSNITVTVQPALTAVITASDYFIGTCLTSVSNLDVNVTGGEAAYSYSWLPVDGLSDPNIKNPVAKPLATTTYTVTVTDANNCTTTAQVTINVRDPLSATASADDYIIGTCPASRSNLNVTVTGGETAYTYSWLPVTGLNDPNVKNPVAKPAATTTYTVTVTDNNGCTTTADVTVTVQDPLAVTATTDDNILSSCPASVANLNATVTGGEAAYSYSWSPVSGLDDPSSPTPEAKPATTTTYTVIVTDANGCTATSSVVINVRPELAVTASASDYTIGTCLTSQSTLNVNVTGGEAGYLYSWTPVDGLSDAGVSNPVAKPLVTTTYTVTVTDANNCQTSANVTIIVAPELTVTTSVNDDLIGTCPDSKAQLIATPAGGEGPYTYSWDNATFLDNATKVNPLAKPNVSTVFTVTVTDANGCTATAPATVNVAPELTATAIADDQIISTCPASVANLDVNVAGGEELAGGGYTYSWAPSTGLNYTNVKTPIAKPSVTTTYTITVTDRNSCTSQSQVTIEVKAPLALTYTTQKYNGGYDISCKGASDGEIDLTISGGENPYTFSWTGPSGFVSTDEDITGLAAGTYNVTATDVNGCQVSTIAVLTEPVVLTLSKTSDVVLACYGDATATGLFSASGGTAPYVFNVISNTSNASTTGAGNSLSFTNGAVGIVQVEVADANGCTATQTITITQPDALLPGSVSGDQEVCYFGDPSLLDEITAPSGGPVSSYNYQWEYASNINGPYNPVIGAFANIYDPPAGITATTYYRRKVTSGTCIPVYSDTVTVTVNPLPVAGITGSDYICPADNATLTVTITTGTGPFTVKLSDGTEIPGYDSGDPITVNPVISTTYTITSVTDANGCIVTAPHANLTGSANIAIKTVPEIMQQPANKTACEGETVLFTVDAGMTTNPAYQWYVDRNDMAGPQILAGEQSSTLSIVTDPSINGYKYSVAVSGDCTPSVTSVEAVLSINNLPEITVQPVSDTVCSGENAEYTVNSGVTTNAEFTWYVNTGTGWNMAVGARYQGTFNDTLTVVSVTELMSGYKYKVRVSGTCTPFTESDEVSLTVTRQAEIVSPPVNVSICEGEDAEYTVDAGLTTGPSYQWQILNGAVWEDIPGETNDNLVVSAVTSAMNGNSYRVVVSSTCGSSVNSGTAILNVYEIPEILEQPHDTIVCAGANVNFSIDPGATTGASYQWQMSTDAGMSWVNVPSGGNYMGSTNPTLSIYGVDSAMTGYRYKVILSGICDPEVESSPAILTINTAPKITLNPEDQAICEFESLSFNAMATGTSLNYQWQVDKRDGYGFINFSDTAGIYSGTATNQLDIINAPRRLNNYRFRAVITGTCSPQALTTFAVLTINTPPEITTQPVPETICEFNSVSFSVNVDGANLSFIWQESIAGGVFNDLADTGNYIGTSTASMNIFNVNRTKDGNRYRVIIIGECNPPASSNNVLLTVKTSPVVTVSPKDTTVCQNNSAGFSVTAEGSDLQYQWQVSTGGSYSAIADGAVYAGTTTPVLSVLSAVPVMNNYRYRVLVSGSCVPPVNSEYGTLRIVNNPQITFQPVAAEICENGNTNFTAAAIGPELVYRWQVNTGSGFTDISDNVNYSGSGTSSLTITNAPVSFNNNIYRLEVRNACLPVYTNEVVLVVNANPVANITGDGSFPLVCGGTDLNLNGNPSGGSGTYLTHSWTGSVGPLSTTLEPQTVFNTLVHGNYDLTYTVTDNKSCQGSSTVTIENNIPDARFISNAVPSCGFIMVDFTNQSTGAVSYEWDFDDGSAPDNTISPSHGFENINPSGQVNYYEVKLTATSDKGCSDLVTQIITIYPKVDPTFDIDPVEGCHPLTATLVTQPGAYNYEWNYGDGQQQTAGYTVVHEFRNLESVVKTYEVKLTTTSYYGCRASSTKTVTVHPIPQPSFTVSPIIQTFPSATINITNLVTPGPWNYLYRFGDGNTSTQESPVHTYTEPGTYKITQVISTSLCADSANQSVIINPALPIAGFVAPTPGCTPLQINFTNTSQYATSYIWDFGDGGVSTKKDPVYIYFDPGNYAIRLTVNGPGGSDTHTETLQVYETPNVGFSLAPDTVFEDYKPAKFFNFTVGSTTNYMWDFGDINEDTGDKSSQNTSTDYEPTHVYEHPGWKDVKLIAYNENCSDTLLKEEAILVLPRKEFQFPNVFRPNPDGPSGGYYDKTDENTRNQVFYPGVADDVLEYFMYIYNRWGELVFESREINRGWDGYINDRMAAQGVYVWKVKGKYLNGENFVFAGNVTLLH